MNPYRLARIAAEAEIVRLRGLFTRYASRAAFGAVAAIFVLGALVFLHMAAWYGVSVGLNQSFLATAFIMFAIDLVIAGILGWMATRSAPSRVEVEALEVRRKAVAGIGSALSLAQLAMPVLRLGVNMRRRRR